MAYLTAEEPRGPWHARKPLAASRMPGATRRGTRTAWRRPDCLNPSVLKTHVTSTGNGI
jgi:hypothetical protein